ncbi:unnamed protein product [Closterium sp. NIES-64]|nr:unnamed protein product [Closterium sp. NIES-64]
MSMRPARSGAHVPALLRAVGRACWNHSPLPASAAASQRLAREQTAGPEAPAAEAEGGMAQGAGQEAEGRVGGEGSAQEEEWRRQAEEARERLLRAYADMENLRQRAQRDVDAARLFAVQVPPVQVPPVQCCVLAAQAGFAKGLADVADNLSRAAASASLPPHPASPDSGQGKGGEGGGGRDPEALLKSLLDGVEMTEKQLMQVPPHGPACTPPLAASSEAVFRQHGMERHDPMGQRFDPNLHNAVFELEDPTKEPGTIAHVLKVGYTLHGRVVRPADVGVVKGSHA